MAFWTITNQNDGNDSFEVEGDNYETAAYEALCKLGWSVSVKKEDEESDN